MRVYANALTVKVKAEATPAPSNPRIMRRPAYRYSTASMCQCSRRRRPGGWWSSERSEPPGVKRRRYSDARWRSDRRALSTPGVRPDAGVGFRHGQTSEPHLPALPRGSDLQQHQRGHVRQPAPGGAPGQERRRRPSARARRLLALALEVAGGGRARAGPRAADRASVGLRGGSAGDYRWRETLARDIVCAMAELTPVPRSPLGRSRRVGAARGPLAPPRLARHAPAVAIASPQAPRRWLALAVLCVSLLVVTLDNTVLNVVLPTLVRELRASDSNLQWIVDAYVLVFGGLLLVAGSVADRVGRKRTFLAGLVAFAAGSSWAAFSGSVGMLIAARASMGIGGALIMPSTLSIITAMFTERGERQLALGLWAGTSGAGSALGPIVGGLLLAHFWWGSVFLINVPIAALGLAFAVRLVPDSRNPRAARPDATGALLSILGLGLVLWAIIEAPVHGWGSAIVVGAGAAGLASLIAFAAWERQSSHPMLNLGFFSRRSFTAAMVSVGMLMFGLMSALFLMTQLLQFQLGYSPLQAGVRTLPAAGSIAVVAPLSGVLVRRLGVKLTVAGGLLVAAGGLWQISGASITTTFGGILPGMVMIGVGAGLVMPAAVGSIMGSLPGEHLGVGSATNGTFVQVGGALGVAVIGSLLSTRYQGRLADEIGALHPPPAAEQAILGSLGGALSVARQLPSAAGQLLEHLARSAFISGLHLGLGVGAVAVAGAALVALLALPSRVGGGERG